jgi:thiol:disulfide interchange protein DsbD
MGLVFGLVAAPCLGPVVAALLFMVAKIGSPLKGFSMFFTLSMGMGVPFFFLALFSGSLSRLPRAGMWMVTVRKVFGFLLLGTAAYYISQLLPEKTAKLAIPAFMIAAGLYWTLLERSTRRMRIVRPVQQVLGIGIIVIGAWSIFAPTAPSIEWTQYTPQAVTAAKEAGKPVMIDFTADWCIPCKEMKKVTFSNPAVYKESQRFVRLSVDLTRKSEAADNTAKTYKVSGPPTVILIDSTGKEQERTVGFIKPDKLLNLMREVK